MNWEYKIKGHDVSLTVKNTPAIFGASIRPVCKEILSKNRQIMLD